MQIIAQSDNARAGRTPAAQADRRARGVAPA